MDSHRYDPDRHHRRSIRLPGYDYAGAGAYYVTICAFQMLCLFGEIVDGEVVLSTLGCVVDEEWRRTAQVRPGVRLDAYVIMPNHLHGIVIIARDEELGDALPGGAPPGEATQGDAPHRPYGPRLEAGSLGTIVGQFKAQAARRINRVRGAPGEKVWQRNYYEHIIRDADDLTRIRRYICDNPSHWPDDRYHPDNP